MTELDLIAWHQKTRVRTWYDAKEGTYRGQIHFGLQRRWRCDHKHRSREAAEACATDQLERSRRAMLKRWGQTEIVSALRAWRDAEGRWPDYRSWDADLERPILHPPSALIRHRFEYWNAALSSAGRWKQ